MIGDFDSQAEIKRLLNENLRLLNENNQLLRKMRRASAWSAIFRFLKYVIIIGVAVYVYFQYVAPNSDKIKDSVNYVKELSHSVMEMKAMYEAMPQEAPTPQESDNTQTEVLKEREVQSWNKWVNNIE